MNRCALCFCIAIGFASSAFSSEASSDTILAQKSECLRRFIIDTQSVSTASEIWNLHNAYRSDRDLFRNPPREDTGLRPRDRTKAELKYYSAISDAKAFGELVNRVKFGHTPDLGVHTFLSPLSAWKSVAPEVACELLYAHYQYQLQSEKVDSQAYANLFKGRYMRSSFDSVVDDAFKDPDGFGYLVDERLRMFTGGKKFSELTVEDCRFLNGRFDEQMRNHELDDIELKLELYNDQHEEAFAEFERLEDEWKTVCSLAEVQNASLLAEYPERIRQFLDREDVRKVLEMANDETVTKLPLRPQEDLIHFLVEMQSDRLRRTSDQFDEIIKLKSRRERAERIRRDFSTTRLAVDLLGEVLKGELLPSEVMEVRKKLLGGVNIAESLSLYAAGAISPLSMLGGIAAGFQAITGETGPTIEEQILESVTLLRRELENLRLELHSRFDRVEDLLLMVDERMTHNIEIVLGNLYYARQDIQAIRLHVELLREESFNRRQQEVFEASQQSESELSELLEKISDRDYRRNLNEKEFLSKLLELKEWATTKARLSVLNKAKKQLEQLRTEDDAFHRLLFDELLVWQPPEMVGLLGQAGRKLGNTHMTESLVNPLVWDAVASEYLTLVEEKGNDFPKIKKPELTRHILDEGEKLNRAFESIRQPEFQTRLLKNYLSRVEHLEEIITEQKKNYELAHLSGYDLWGGTDEKPIPTGIAADKAFPFINQKITRYRKLEHSGPVNVIQDYMEKDYVYRSNGQVGGLAPSGKKFMHNVQLNPPVGTFQYGELQGSLVSSGTMIKWSNDLVWRRETGGVDIIGEWREIGVTEADGPYQANLGKSIKIQKSDDKNCFEVVYPDEVTKEFNYEPSSIPRDSKENLWLASVFPNEALMVHGIFSGDLGIRPMSNTTSRIRVFYNRIGTTDDIHLIVDICGVLEYVSGDQKAPKTITVMERRVSSESAISTKKSLLEFNHWYDYTRERSYFSGFLIPAIEKSWNGVPHQHGTLKDTLPRFDSLFRFYRDSQDLLNEADRKKAHDVCESLLHDEFQLHQDQFDSELRNNVVAQEAAKQVTASLLLIDHFMRLGGLANEDGYSDYHEAIFGKEGLPHGSMLLSPIGQKAHDPARLKQAKDRAISLLEGLEPWEIPEGDITLNPNLQHLLIRLRALLLDQKTDDAGL